MTTIIDALREIIGTPNSFIGNDGNGMCWSYDNLIEYIAAVLILCIVISSVFKFINKIVG